MERVVQGWNQVTVDATPEAVWKVLEDGDRLTEWAFMVQTTTGGREEIGAVRHCDVEFAGKRGKVSERCVEFEPHGRIAWELVEDSLGFSKMFTEMGFAFILAPAPNGRTIVRNESFYRPPDTRRTCPERPRGAPQVRRNTPTTPREPQEPC